jgi:hypothetical protein
MTYTNETQRILNAIITGDCCSDCNAPHGDRHFDECPQHPENVQQKAKRLASEFEAYGKSQALEVIKTPEAVDRIRRLEAFKHLHRDCGERFDGIRDERDELLVRVQELTAELEAVRAERDAARVVGS